MKKVNKICVLGVGIAMYFVLGLMVKIPIVSHIKIDLGYVAFGTWCCIVGPYAFIVGAIGCMLESLLLDGWIPIGWMLAQTLIGIVCGNIYKENKNVISCLFVTYISLLIGIGVIKTSVECMLYGIPFSIKFAKNIMAVIPDSFAMIVGYFVYRRLDKVIVK